MTSYALFWIHFRKRVYRFVGIPTQLLANSTMTTEFHRSTFVENDQLTRNLSSWHINGARFRCTSHLSTRWT